MLNENFNNSPLAITEIITMEKQKKISRDEGEKKLKSIIGCSH
jgi:hypothetical protein